MQCTDCKDSNFSHRCLEKAVLCWMIVTGNETNYIIQMKILIYLRTVSLKSNYFYR